jgi:hypothetical protein
VLIGAGVGFAGAVLLGKGKEDAPTGGSLGRPAAPSGNGSGNVKSIIKGVREGLDEAMSEARQAQREAEAEMNARYRQAAGRTDK